MKRWEPLTFRILTKIGAENEKGCWEWTGGLARGYASIRTNHPRGTARVSRLVYDGANPEPLGDQMACHTCDNPKCINPAHLFAGTGTANMQDCASKGRTYKAPLNSKGGKTTIAQREEIRQRYAAGESQADLAVAFSVRQTRISQIVNGGKDRRKYRKYHSPETVRAIRMAGATVLTQVEIAEHFGLSQATVSRILRGESATNVQ